VIGIVLTLIILTVAVVLIVLYTTKKNEDAINAEQCYAEFENAAVISDDERCNIIGKEILQKGGSLVDGIIAVTLCIGVVNPQSSGIGGGFFMTYLDEEADMYTVNARETAPAWSNPTMYENIDESTVGAKSVAVPGQIRGFWEAWKKFGVLPWAELYQPSIDLARHGFEISNTLASSISSKSEFIHDPKNHMMLYLHDDGRLREEGDLLVDFNLAFTLEEIANHPDTFYTGTLANDILHDLEEAGGLITQQDLEGYKVVIDENPTVNNTVNLPYFNLTMLIPPAPSSGAVLAYMLGTYDLYNDTKPEGPTDIEYQRIAEIMKFAYGQRSHLGDPIDAEFSESIWETLTNLTDPKKWVETKNKIEDDKTYNDPEHYNGGYTKPDHGTSHMSIMTKDAAISLTTTINLSFGSKLRGRRTGIMYNNEMDDFSYPGITNAFGVEPSPSNYAKPGKRPQSSMCPTILFDSVTKKPVMTLGGAGGTKITTASMQNAINVLSFKMDASYAVSTPRLHHQLLPMRLEYQVGFEEDMVELLAEKEHEMYEYSYTTGSAPMIYRTLEGVIQAKSENRRPYSQSAGY